MKILILVLSLVLSFGNINASPQKEKPQEEKVEVKNSNNCPVACNKTCKKDPKTCKKAQKFLKNTKEKDNKKDTTKVKKSN